MQYEDIRTSLWTGVEVETFIQMDIAVTSWNKTF